jgi:hypothetical protein
MGTRTSRRTFGLACGPCVRASRSIKDDVMSKFDEIQNDVKSTPGLGKSMAKWSALGAVVAIPVPVIGPIFGALAGAGYAYYKGKKKV